MKKYILPLLTICIISFVGCKKQDTINSVTCVSGTNLNEEGSLSSIFSKVEIVPLETTDESLIGQNINKIRKKDHKYFISYDNKVLVIFDRQGKFLFKIQKIGGGPGEYTRLQDFDVLPDGNIIIADVRKLLFYSSTGEFIKAIPLDISCFGLRVIDDDSFLIYASAQEYSIYLLDGEGKIKSKQLKRENRRTLGRSVSFYAMGNDHVIYQQYFSNDFLCFNTKTREFTNVNLFCNDDDILRIEKVNQYQDKFHDLGFAEKNPNVKTINGIASYIDYMFIAVADNSKPECYLMNTSNSEIEYKVTENTVDDIGFTGIFSLLGNIVLSDAEDCFITSLFPYQIMEGLNKKTQFNEHPNYQRFQSLFKDIRNIEEENPVLIELRVR